MEPMAGQDSLPRALVRSIALCVLLGVVVGALLSAHRRATLAQLATLTAISVLYSSTIGLPAMLVFRRVRPRLSGQPGTGRRLLHLAILLAITAVGALVAGLVLVAVGQSTLAELWPSYVQGLEIALAIVELASTADGMRVRLGDGKTELQVARERARALKDKL